MVQEVHISERNIVIEIDIREVDKCEVAGVTC
jgi:hypothetical protein